MRGKAYRRAQQRRAFNKAYRLVTRYPYKDRVYPGSFDYDPAQVARYIAGNRAKCSCMMCGNPRKWMGERTMAERIADLDDVRSFIYDSEDE